MTLFQAELKYYLRSPIVWLIMAVTAFISAWSFLLSIDVFTSLQVKFAGMSDAPTIFQGIIVPVISSQTKLLIIIIAIIGGLSFARLSQNNGWNLILFSQLTAFKIIRQKFMAQLLVVGIFLLPVILFIFYFSLIAHVQFIAILISLFSLFLLIIWMLALAMMLSSFSQNSGFAILLCVMVFIALLFLSFSSVDAQWGKNWLQVLSPFYHFNQINQQAMAASSLFYFIMGSTLSLWITKARLMHKRYLL